MISNAFYLMPNKLDTRSSIRYIKQMKKERKKWMNEWMNGYFMHGSEPESESITYIHTYIHTQIVTYITHTGAPKIENWKSRKKIPIHSISIGLSPININQSIKSVKDSSFPFWVFQFVVFQSSIFFRSKLYLLYSTLPYPLSSPLTRDRIKLRH